MIGRCLEEVAPSGARKQLARRGALHYPREWRRALIGGVVGGGLRAELWRRGRAERRARREARGGAVERLELLGARAALRALDGAVLLLEDEPRLITKPAAAHACLRALDLAANAGAGDILARLRASGPEAATKLADLDRRGTPCDFKIAGGTGVVIVCGRSAGALAWLRLEWRTSPPAARPSGFAKFATFEAGLLDALADAVALFDADRRLAWHNAAFAQLWSLEAAWLAERPSHGEWLDRLRRRRRLPETPDYAAFKAAELARHRAIRASDPIIWRLPDERLLRVTSQPRTHGGLALIFSDITRETALVSRINQLTQVRQAIVNTLTDAVTVFAGDGRLTLHNAAFEQFFGLDAREIADQPDFDGVARLCVARLHDLAFWRDLKGRITDADPGVRMDGSGEIQLGDGRWAAWRCRPLPDGATLVGFTDATHGRRLAQALAEREAALGEAERMRRAFVASVSYELRIPLTTVLGYCDLIDRGGRLADPRDKAWLAAARAAAGQLATSIEDVLTLAELDAGELALEFESVDIAALMADAAAARAKAAAEAGVMLRVEPIGGEGGHARSPIRADPGRLRRALDHLIANALRHTPAGGTIRLVAERADGEARIAVIDDGRGIPFDIQARAFERLGAQGPTGLGLPLVRALIELHGGWVALESEPGAGASFTCHLPEAPSLSEDRPELFARDDLPHPTRS